MRRPLVWVEPAYGGDRSSPSTQLQVGPLAHGARMREYDNQAMSGVVRTCARQGGLLENVTSGDRAVGASLF
jgi:hypothetical protein